MLKLNAVFQGGGVKGIALVSALNQAVEEGLSFSSVAGTSAGSIVAALAAAGYTSGEMLQIMDELDFRSLLDPSWPRLLSLWRKYGYYKGDKFRNWIYKLLAKRGVRTFGDLRDFELTIIASDLSKRKILRFNNISHRDMDIADAVRMSISIPLFFQAVRWFETLVVDGGVLSNFPLRVYDESKAHTFGFKLVNRDPEMAPVAPRSLQGYLMELIATMLEAHDKDYEDGKKPGPGPGTFHVMEIETGNIPATKFDLTKDDKAYLRNSGFVAATRFLKTEPIKLIIQQHVQAKTILLAEQQRQAEQLLRAQQRLQAEQQRHERPNMGLMS